MATFENCPRCGRDCYGCICRDPAGPRRRVCYLADSDIIGIAMGKITVSFPGVPKDARVARVFYCPERGGFGFAFDHVRFAPVAPGREAPVVVAEIVNAPPAAAGPRLGCECRCGRPPFTPFTGFTGFTGLGGAVAPADETFTLYASR